jgi:hypothetical protein
MTLRRGPYHAFRPGGEASELLNLGMILRVTIGKRQAGGIKNPRFCTEGLEQSLGSKVKRRLKERSRNEP